MKNTNFHFAFLSILFSIQNIAIGQVIEYPEYSFTKIELTPNSKSSQIDMVASPDNTFLAVYVSDSNVYCEKHLSDYTLVYKSKVNTIDSLCMEPKIVSFSNGAYAICYKVFRDNGDHVQDGSQHYLQFYSANHTKIGNEKIFKGSAFAIHVMENDELVLVSGGNSLKLNYYRFDQYASLLKEKQFIMTSDGYPKIPGFIQVDSYGTSNILVGIKIWESPDAYFYRINENGDVISSINYGEYLIPLYGSPLMKFLPNGDYMGISQNHVKIYSQNDDEPNSTIVLYHAEGINFMAMDFLELNDGSYLLTYLQRNSNALDNSMDYFNSFRVYNKDWQSLGCDIQIHNTSILNINTKYWNSNSIQLSDGSLVNSYPGRNSLILSKSTYEKPAVVPVSGVSFPEEIDRTIRIERPRNIKVFRPVILPYCATDLSIQVYSDNESVFKCMYIENSQVVYLEAVSYGVANLTMTTNDGGFSVSRQVKVGADVESVELNTSSAQLAIGEQLQLDAVVKPDNSAVKMVKWLSSNSLIAKVDNNGLVTKVANGSVDITVKTEDGGYTANCMITDKIIQDEYLIHWTDFDGTKVEGNVLKKTRLRNAWYEGAASFNRLPSNTDGWIETTVSELNTFRMFGLSEYNANATWNTINYNLYLTAYNIIYIYENGIYKGRFNTFKIGDVVRLERVGNEIRYLHNGMVFYTSPCEFSKSLIADVSIYSTNATLSNCKASFPANNTNPYPVQWNDMVQVFEDNNTLIRTDVKNYSWVAGAASINRLLSWTDGWIQTQVQETNKYRMIGLSSDNTDPYWNTIDYNLYLHASGKIYIYQSGSYKGIFGTYRSGDVVKIAREGSMIKYYKNDVVLYSSSCDPSTHLIGDVSMYTGGSTLYDVKASFRSYDQFIPSGNLRIASSKRDIFVSPDVDSLSIKMANLKNNMFQQVENKTIEIAYDNIKSDSLLFERRKIVLSPNPTNGLFNLQYNSYMEVNLLIEVYNYESSKLFERKWSIVEGINEISLDISSYPEGLYFINVSDGNEIYSLKILKE